MRLLVAKRKRRPPDRRLLSFLGILGAAALIFAVVCSPKVVGTSAAARKLPVYCVQRDGKHVSLTFDAAWGNEDTELIDYVSELSRVRKSIPSMRDGMIFFVINEKETHDSRLIGFTRKGQKQEYVFFVNRSSDTVQLGNISGILSRYTDIQPFYGEFMDDTITVKPYGYTIIKAKFVK